GGGCCRSERGVDRRRRPRVGRRSAAAGVAVAAAVPARLVDLRRRVAQRRADLVDVELDDRALLAFLGLERPLLQSTLHDDPGTPGQGFGDVLRSLPPHRAPHKQRLAVTPLPRLPVERTRRRRDSERRDRRTRRREPQFRVGGEVPNDRDLYVSGHDVILPCGADSPGEARRRPLGVVSAWSALAFFVGAVCAVAGVAGAAAGCAVVGGDTHAHALTQETVHLWHSLLVLVLTVFIAS